MSNNFKNDVYLAEIKDIQHLVTRNDAEFWKLELNISNLKIKNQRVNICIFENNSYFSKNDLIKLIGASDEKTMIGKLFYCNIDMNEKGFPFIKAFYMTIDETKLLFDPRKNVMLATKIERKTNLKRIIGG